MDIGNESDCKAGDAVLMFVAKFLSYLILFPKRIILGKMHRRFLFCVKCCNCPSLHVLFNCL
jgi:hypothetical protein